MSFLPGAHVFPGGRVEENDNNFAMLLATDQDNIARIQKHFDFDIATVSRSISAAIRETFEESGLTILRIGPKQQHCDGFTLKGLLDATTSPIPISLDNLWPIAWWITPLGETRRYDTWFFLALIDDETIAKGLPMAKDQESSGSLWIAPDEALKAFEDGHIFLAPPTRTILERMAHTANLADFLSYVDRPLFPIRPFFVENGDRPLLVLPGDPLHNERQRSALPMHTRYFFS